MPRLFENMSPSQREAIRKKAAQIHATPATRRVDDLPCPDCRTYLVLTKTMYGRYYKCPKPGCKGHYGARPNGTPTGVPQNNRTWYNVIDAGFLDDEA